MVPIFLSFMRGASCDGVIVLFEVKEGCRGGMRLREICEGRPACVSVSLREAPAQVMVCQLQCSPSRYSSSSFVTLPKIDKKQ